MIVVRVELWSAKTGAKTELARMEICNDGTSAGEKRNYVGRVLRGRSREALDRAAVQCRGAVKDWPSNAVHVWNLVATMLSVMGYGDKRSERKPHYKIVPLKDQPLTVEQQRILDAALLFAGFQRFTVFEFRNFLAAALPMSIDSLSSPALGRCLRGFIDRGLLHRFGRGVYGQPLSSSSQNQRGAA